MKPNTAKSGFCLLAALVALVFPGEGQEPTSREAALSKLKLPEVRINLQERSVDIVATVCFGEGELERVACANDSKEHESIIAIDASGNVISIATFGDELLCLPDVHSHENGALLWQIDSTHFFPFGTKITLRLRPQTKPTPAPSPLPHRL